MGNVISDCLPKKKKSQGYRLGNIKDHNNNTSGGNRAGGEREKKSGGVKGRTSGGQTLGGNGRTIGSTGDKNEGGPSREDIAAAAQKRQENVSKIFFSFFLKVKKKLHN